MVPRWLDGERQLLRTGLRQGAGRYSQEGLVPGRQARERQLLHSLTSTATQPSWRNPVLMFDYREEYRIEDFVGSSAPLH